MKLRIAIVGGDSRAEAQYRWGRDHSFTFYQAEKYGGNGEAKKLAAALAAGKFDVVVTLTRWMGHSMYGAVKNNARCRVVTWDRGIGDLTKYLPELVAGRQAA